jgi:hypothetical protein
VGLHKLIKFGQQVFGLIRVIKMHWAHRFRGINLAETLRANLFNVKGLLTPCLAHAYPFQGTQNTANKHFSFLYLYLSVRLENRQHKGCMVLSQQ